MARTHEFGAAGLMFSPTDTIVAIATPPGRGGLGVVRLSGPGSHAIARRLTTHTSPFVPRRATFTAISIDDARIDQVVVTFFPAPGSYTGDDTVELSAHGSNVVLRATVEAAVAHGARVAEPGEFTLRAFLNGRIDLPQAEAVADLIDAVTPLQARVAFDQLQGTLTSAIAAISDALFDLIARLEASVDFPEEGFHFLEPRELKCGLDSLIDQTAQLLADSQRGRLVREGFQVAIVGKPNVGKSSLFNALAGSSRAIVTAIPGTTRDLVTEVVEMDGFRVTLTDTAGLRIAADEIEVEGIQRARGAIATSDLVLVVFDGSTSLDESDRQIISYTSDLQRVMVSNKSDIQRSDNAVLSVSARTGEGLEALRRAVISSLGADTARDRPAITNLRHINLVRRAHDALSRARDSAGTNGRQMPEEFLLADLQEARIAFEEVSGKRATEDLLEHIFSRFCIGK